MTWRLVALCGCVCLAVSACAASAGSTKGPGVVGPTARRSVAPASKNSPPFSTTSTTSDAQLPSSECIADRLAVTVTPGTSSAPRCVRRGTLIVVTFEDAGKRTYRWSEPASSDALVLRRVAATSGVVATGSFEAVATGSAIVTAVDAPTCVPACLAPEFHASLTIFVE